MPSYYLRYFYAHDEVVRELRTQAVAGRRGGGDRAASCWRCTPTRRWTRSRSCWSERGGAFYSEAAVDLVASLLGDGPAADASRWSTPRNGGTLPFLPDDAVIEVPARVDRRRRRRRCRSTPVDPLFAGLIAHVTAYEDLALEAALHGGRDRVFDALLAHPLVGQDELADGLTDRLHRPQPGAPAVGVTDDADWPGVLADRRRQQQDRRRRSSRPTARVLGTARGAGFQPHAGRCRGRGRRARRRWWPRPPPRPAGLGADGPVVAPRLGLPGQRRPAGRGATAGQQAIDAPRLGRSQRRSVNDTFALLRAGVDEPRGVAVVCGAGINCRGVLPDGRTARFPAVGHISGDWGGGWFLWQEALWWAARAEDGRGDRHRAAGRPAGRFGLPSMQALIEAVHLGEICRPSAATS